MRALESLAVVAAVLWATRPVVLSSVSTVVGTVIVVVTVVAETVTSAGLSVGCKVAGCVSVSLRATCALMSCLVVLSGSAVGSVMEELIDSAANKIDIPHNRARHVFMLRGNIVLQQALLVQR